AGPGRGCHPNEGWLGCVPRAACPRRLGLAWSYKGVVGARLAALVLYVSKPLSSSSSAVVVPSFGGVSFSAGSALALSIAALSPDTRPWVTKCRTCSAPAHRQEAHRRIPKIRGACQP